MLSLVLIQEQCPDNSVGAHTESPEQVSSLTGFLEEVPALSVDPGEREKRAVLGEAPLQGAVISAPAVPAASPASVQKCPCVGVGGEGWRE